MSAIRQAVKPRALRPGMKVGVIAPAGPVNPADLERGLAALRSWGYEPVHDESIVKSVGYFAGTVERRCQELVSMFECTEIGAILCARGGYGCTNICPKIDIDTVRRNPKIFLGASDVTALLTWFHDATGLVTFHGPMVAREIA